MPPTFAHASIRDSFLESSVKYLGPMTERPRYYADDGSRDNLQLDTRVVRVDNARLWSRPASLCREGFELIQHRSEVRDFDSPEEIAGTYRPEIERLLLELTAADQVVVAAPAVRRSARRGSNPIRLTSSGPLFDTRPVCFVHVDISNSTARRLANRYRPTGPCRTVRRFAHYNIWRVLSPPPQDLPLALCDARSVTSSDLVEADAMMDIPGKRQTSYTGLVARYNSRHLWSHFPRMHRDEALIFKTHDSEPGQPSHVPHVAFNDPTCPAQVAPRVSFEMRALAYWFAA